MKYIHKIILKIILNISTHIYNIFCTDIDRMIQESLYDKIEYNGM